MGFAVNTDEVRQAAVKAYEAHQFFNDKLAGLREIVADAADNPFDGGLGKTGNYQGALTRFNTRFLQEFQKFVDDEALFVTFLEQLHARLNQSASLYDSIEEQNTTRLTSIANKLDEQGG